MIAKVFGSFEGGNHPICWLSGPPGSGKSAISQTVAEWYAVDKRLAASFFFLRGAGNRSKIANLIATLAYEISLSVPGTKPFIQKVLQNHPSITRQSLAHQFEKLLADPVRAARDSTHPPEKPMVIVVDALDECDDKELMAEFVNVVIDACREYGGLPFRVFFTSRLGDYIQEELKTHESRSVTCHLALQDFDARSDIHKFFQTRFSNIYDRNHRRMKNVALPWPSQSDLNALTAKCHGSFSFAVALIDFIDDHAKLPHRKIQLALRKDDCLDQLYSQVLTAAPRDDNFESTIGAIIFVTSPLPLTSLADLLQLETADVLQALRGVQSIFIIPEDDDESIQLYHPSLRDFLVTQSRSMNFFIDPPARHLSLAIDCLIALKSQPGNKDVYYGAQEYACLNWCHHLHQGLSRQLEGNRVDSVSERSLMSCLTDVVSQPLSCDRWVNTIISKGRLSQILNSLQLVLQRLQVNNLF